MEYAHTQRAPLYYIILGIAVLLLTLAWQAGQLSTDAIIVSVAAGVIVVIAFSFRSLTVTDEGPRLSVRFGPIPLFGTSIEYSDITRVEPGRSSLIDGWGIHYVPWRGWTFNLWGFGCVVVHVRKKIVRIGTDDVENLAQFLQKKTGI